MSSVKVARRRTLLFSALAVVAGIVTISACSTEENPSAGTLSVAVSPSSINVAPGGTGNTSVTLTRGGSFTGPVGLSQSGAPAGIAVTFTPSTVPAAITASTVNVSIGAAVAPGSHAITISAEGDNVTTATTTLTVVVVGGEAGSITLAADPAAISVTAGAVAPVTSALTITRNAPFAGAVALSVTGAPGGVTASVSPASVAAGGTTATLSVTAAGSAVNGTYPLVVRGSGTGIADVTTTVNATVTGGSSAGASFAFAPASLPITAGGASGTSTVTITRTGSFAPAGALNLTLTGAPAGMTATVAPSANVTAGTAVVTVQATNAVAAATYNLTLTGTGTGIPNAVGTLPVVVSGGGGGGGTFTAAFCTADAPIWVAAQDGAGAWTRVNPTTGSTYSFTFASGKGGVAVVDTVGAGYDMTVVYGTVAEFQNYATAINVGNCGSKTVNGSVANVGNTEVATVTLGYASDFVIGATGTTYQLTDVADGNQDLIAARVDVGTFTTNKLILRRGLNPANNGSIPVLDFNAAEAFTPDAGTVTVSNLGADQASISAVYAGTYAATTLGVISTIESYTSASGAVAFTAVPLLQLQALDLQELVANATATNSMRTAGLFFRAPAAKTITMGAALSTPIVSKLVTGTNARPRVQLTGQADYNRLFMADYEQSTLDRSATVAATAAYFGGSPPATWDVTLPDLSGAAGWTPTWGLQNGTGITWTVTASGGTILFLDGNNIVDGNTFKSASVNSSTPLSVRAARTAPDRFSLFRNLATTVREELHPIR